MNFTNRGIERGLNFMNKENKQSTIPLGLLSSGEQGEIVSIRPGKAPTTGQCSEEREKYDCRVEEMGLRVGKLVEMLNNGGVGAVLLKVGDARIAIDRGTAMKIMIKEAGR
jgi:ferrous iron transport protein A